MRRRLCSLAPSLTHSLTHSLSVSYSPFRSYSPGLHRGNSLLLSRSPKPTPSIPVKYLWLPLSSTLAWGFQFCFNWKPKSRQRGLNLWVLSRFKISNYLRFSWLETA